MRIAFWSVVALAAVAACGFGDNTGHLQSQVDGGADGSVAGGDAATSDATVAADAAIDTDCTLLPQSGCAGGAACDLTAADDGTIACRAVTASGTSDSRCEALTACSAGYSCVGELGVDSSCMRFCADDTGCSGTGSRCAFGLTDGSGMSIGVKVCSNACDPYLQTGCPAQMGCLAFDMTGGDITDCRVMGTKTDGQTCTKSTDCMAGSLCVNDGTARCRAYCKLGQSGSCPSSQTCSAFSTTLSIGSTSYGFCR
jgi:hypothetical protein